MEIEKIIKNDFTGAVFVKKNDKIIIQRAYGYADIVNRIPNTTDTKFATASAGKVFVAVGILQLREPLKTL